MHRINKTLRIVSLFVVILFSLLNINTVAFANQSEPEGFSFTELYTSDGYMCIQNDESGYYSVVEDMAGLLTFDEQKMLISELKPISKYGHAAIVTLDVNDVGTAEDYAIYYSEYNFNKDSNTVFLIDMQNRKIWIYSYGYIGDEISSSDNDTITDNIYTYATDGRYYECCSKEIAQVYTLLKGGDIPRPMKHIGNGILAIIIALILNYFLTIILSTDVEESNKSLLKYINHKYEFTEPEAVYTHTTSEYSPSSSDSSSDSGSSSGGGSSGGHSF